MNSLPHKPLRGRPRSSEARQAILKAFVTAVKEQGYSKISIDQLSKASGVSRSTIYRWYKEKVDIALDAAASIAEADKETPLSGDLETDLRRHFTNSFNTANTANTLGQLFTAMMAEAQSNPEFSERVWEEFSKLRREHLKTIILQGHTQNSDIELLMDMVMGALWYRMMSGHAALDEAFSQALIKKIQLFLTHSV